AGSAPFDAITLWDVLEHIRDPWHLLGRLAPLLDAGGVLLVRVPDARALTALSGVGAQAYLALCHPTNPEEHPHHYTPMSLEAIAARAGFALGDVQAARDDERVVSAWTPLDRRVRAALHRRARGVPYEFTATLQRTG
ncbi:MAG TPA: methyltransferase domain-containing protein, partial [Solirubrobacteraceae bacterium]